MELISDYKNIKTPKLKAILNIIYNVLNNKTIKINPKQANVLKPYQQTYKKLLNKKISLDKKKVLLRKHGHVYLPVFIDIIGEDIKHFWPKGRRRRDCPVCGKQGLVRLSNHIKKVHGRDRDYDPGDEVIETDGSEESN